MKKKNDAVEKFDLAYDLIFFEKMRAGQVELPELKKFIADKQINKINDIMNQKLDRIINKPVIFTSKMDAMELGKLGAITSMRLNMDYRNLDIFVALVDACNIALNGEENCDIIVGKATEDELQIYVYELMKQFEEKKSKQKIK